MGEARAVQPTSQGYSQVAGERKYHYNVKEHEQVQLIAGNQWPIRKENESFAALKNFCCTFSAPKRVVIGRQQGTFSATAGILYWGFMIMIGIVYILIMSIMYKNKHLKYDQPIGTVRINLVRPTEINSETGGADAPRSTGSRNDYTNILDLPYCSRSLKDYPDEKGDYGKSKRICDIWDEDSVVVRNLGADVSLATYFRRWDQTRVCDGSAQDTTCKKTFKTEETKRAYLADVENFAVTISHSMRTPVIVQEVDMTTRGEGIKVCAAASSKCKHVMPNLTLNSIDNKSDTFKLGTLLSAAGVDLDKPSSAQPNSSSRRLLGTTLVLTIHYENTVPFESWYKAFFNQLQTKYHYTLDELPHPEYKIRDSFYDKKWNSDGRTVVELHGIRFMVLFTGKIGAWSWSQLMVLFSVSVTTLMMSESIVVNFIRRWPFWWESGLIQQKHLSEQFMDYSRDLSSDWRPDLDKAMANVKNAQE